jgi:hypothetical protein
MKWPRHERVQQRQLKIVTAKAGGKCSDTRCADSFLMFSYHGRPDTGFAIEPRTGASAADFGPPTPCGLTDRLTWSASAHHNAAVSFLFTTRRFTRAHVPEFTLVSLAVLQLIPARVAGHK